LSRSRSTSEPDGDLADVDAVFAALAHASRRHILLVLHFRGGEMTAGEIAERFSCSWPTTTRHLKVLEAAGLVEVAQRGRERVYRLAAERLAGVAGAWLKWFTGSRRGPERRAPDRRGDPRRRRRS
jgi:DNA-binding transcriptional ArsR family regulator